jgi:glycosylphosphatidylinositol transamidase (GPIT) subunit GPI8
MFFKQRGGTLSDLMRSYNPSLVNSHPNWKVDLMQRSPDGIPLTDFFGSDVKISPIYSKYNMMKKQGGGEEEEMDENGKEKEIEPIKSEKNFKFSLEKEFYILFSISILILILGLKIKI